METYLFHGKILPERAQISFEAPTRTSNHFVTGNDIQIDVSIKLNQLLVRVRSNDEWNILDLRNLVLDVVTVDMSMIGFLRGFAYDVEITRVVTEVGKVDAVFGIDIPCIAEPRQDIDLVSRFKQLAESTNGEHQIYVNRCLVDLNLAMRHANDTAFYCYRAIEALRKHCAATHNLPTGDRNKSKSWETFRDISNVTKQDIGFVGNYAKEVRHGGPASWDDQTRAQLFIRTWDIIEKYFETLAE